jgi:Fic family protein
MSGIWEEYVWPGDAGGQTRALRQGGRFKAWLPNRLDVAQVQVPITLFEVLQGTQSTLASLQGLSNVAGVEAVSRLFLRSEAIASSFIEGIQVGARRLAAAEFDPGEPDQVAQQVVANIRAIDSAIGELACRPVIGVEDILSVHACLMEPVAASVRPGPGQLRQEFVWIGGSAGPLRAAYVGPHERHLPGLMADLADFLNRNDIPALVQAAIAHAQFETIHPFTDGNGRTGRCLIQAVLVRRGLVPSTLPPISLALAAHRDRYIQGLVDFRADRLDDWLSFFLWAVMDACRVGARLSAELARLEQGWLRGAARRDSTERRLLLDLAGFPIMTVASVARRYGVSDEAARLALTVLEERRIIRQRVLRSRNRVWQAPDVFRLFDVLERTIRSGDLGTEPLG